MEQTNVLEKYLDWGKKTDFSSFEDYINRNLVVGFRIKEYYDFEYLKNNVAENVELGIEHYSKENGLFFPFFEQLFYFDEDKFSLYLVGEYDKVNIKYELGKIYFNLKKSKLRNKKRKMLDFPRFEMCNIDDKIPLLLGNFLKSIINETLENKVIELEQNVKNLDNLKKEYISRKNKYKKMKIK